MEDKKAFGTKLEEFFAGKGFYLVLTLCVAVIGVSAWSMLSDGAAQRQEESSVAVAKVEETLLAPSAAKPTLTPAPPETAAPELNSPAPVETPAPAAAMQDYYIAPLAGEVEVAYSVDALLYSPTMRDWRTHDGVDIAAELGAQVKAAANGRVTQIVHDDLMGTTVAISHANGLESIYANLADTPTVAVGDAVSVGQVIGAVGTTALSETAQASHLHFAMRRDGQSVDPADYLPQ